jgi:two-component system response regulator TctD
MMARVLIAEDEAFTAIALVDTLERLGHLVRDAADGAAAMAALIDFHPDVLVTDLMMPNVDGAALIRHVRASEGPSLPVILISGVPEAKLPENIPYDAYLGKPIDHAELGRVVKALVRRG